MLIDNPDTQFCLEFSNKTLCKVSFYLFRLEIAGKMFLEVKQEDGHFVVAVVNVCVLVKGHPRKLPVWFYLLRPSCFHGDMLKATVDELTD